jgi:hypothetical protein
VYERSRNVSQRKVFGPKREGLTGDWRRLHNEELYALYSSLNITRVSKPRRMIWSGHAVAQCATNRKVTGSILDGVRPPSGPGVDSASNRNAYQGYLMGIKGDRCVRLTALLHSCDDCLEVLGASTSCSPKGLSRFLVG